MKDVQFATALQLMLSLALAVEDERDLVASSELAKALGTNPSLVRKVMALLVRSGLVHSSMGPGGGVRLARAASRITFRDVYLAGAGRKPLLPARTGQPAVCIVSRNFEDLFAWAASRVEDAVLDRLSETTLAEGLAELRRLDARPAKINPLRNSRRPPLRT